MLQPPCPGADASNTITNNQLAQSDNLSDSDFGNDID